jgi:hypothetical protein
MYMAGLRNCVFVSFLLTSPLLLQAQNTTPNLEFDFKTLNSLSTALVKDLSQGDIEWARIHVIQLNGVYLGMAQMAHAKATADGTRPIVNEPSADAQSSLANFSNMRPPGILPANPSATAPLVPLAQEIQAAAENEDLDGVDKEAGSLKNEIATLSVKLSKEHYSRWRQSWLQSISDPVERSYMALAEQLSDALRADDVATAESLAPEVLRQTDRLKSTVTSAAVGQNIYNAYDALGRGAFNRGDYDTAKRDLMLAASTPGGAVLSSFGPDLKLAKELLDKGETETVIQFLTACKSFWKNPAIDQWVVEIKAGQRPSLGRNARHSS